MLYHFKPLCAWTFIGFAACLASAVAFFSVRAYAEEFEEHTVIVEGDKRSFLLHIPANLSKPASVVFVFHGSGGRPQGIAHKSEMAAIADKHGFIAVYPAGAGRDSGFRGAWNVGGSERRDLQGDKVAVSTDDVAFVRAILKEVARIAPIDRSRIYATGLSMGGVFSYRLACEMSDTFAAVAPVAATMVQSSCHPRSPVAILHIHGSADKRIPLEGRRGTNRDWPAPQRGIQQWSVLDHCLGASTRAADASESCVTYNQCAAAVKFCVIADQPHGWPSDPGVSEQIWEFFAANPKRYN